MQNKDIDFGKMGIARIFGKLLFPTLLGMLSTATLIITEGIFVGHGIGSQGLAAINIASPLFMIATGIGLMFGIGASIVASIHLAQNRVKAARINITQAFSVASMLILLISAVVLIFNKPVAYFFGSSDQLLPLVRQYIVWLAPGLVFSTLMNIGLFTIRLDGSPVYAMLCSVLPAIINLFLCWWFVMVLGWGVMGAAFATDIGLLTGGLMVLNYRAFRSRKLQPLRMKINRKYLQNTTKNCLKMAKLGWSAFLGEMAITVMVMLGNYVFMASLGDDGVAAYGVACYCFPLIYMLGSAIAQSAQPIISYNYGAKNWTRVRKTAWLAISTAILSGLAAAIATIWFCQPLISAFLDTDCQAYRIALDGMPYFAVGYVFFTFNMASVGYFQSMERAKRANFLTLLRGFVFMLICFLTLPLLWGDKGIWLAVPGAEILTALVLIVWYFKSPATHSD